MPATTDRTIADRYQLRSQLGRGAMGTVWLAEDSVLKRRVAIKEIDIPPGFDADERTALEARLLREARAAARLNHPGAVGVYDVIEYDGRPWIVMEYVAAPTLAEKIERDGPLQPAEAAEVGLQLLNILEVAHGHGIVHRDVKPSNVMSSEDGHVKLADFGIASIHDDPKITQTGLVLGSPSFMAPEQAHSGITGPEADLWSLGATLYQAVEGQPPFDKGAPLPTLTAVMAEDPRPMTRAGPLEGIIRRLLDKDPAARPSIEQTRSMLEDVVRDGTSPPTLENVEPAPVVDARAIPATVEHAGAAVATPAEPSPYDTQPRRSPGRDRKWLAWAAVALGIVALVAIPLVLSLRDDETEPRTRRDAAADTAEAGEDGGGASGSGSDSGSDAGGGSVPGDWVAYEDPAAGYTLYHPPTWETSPNSETQIDFVDPGSGTYLRVEWTDQPGEDVMARLEDIAEGFAGRHDAYEELQMTPTEYQGHDAGLWEYTYVDGGASLHAYNLQFVIGDDYGFALNFQTHEDDWDAQQSVWEALQAGFVPPA